MCEKPLAWGQLHREEWGVEGEIDAAPSGFGGWPKYNLTDPTPGVYAFLGGSANFH